MKKKLLAGGIAAALLATGIGFAANSNVSTGTTVASVEGVQVTTATTGTPAWDAPVVDMSGNITGGKLYEISATKETDAKTIRLYLTNADDMKKAYHYVTQNVKITKQAVGQTPAEDKGEQVLSLENGYVEFTVEGGVTYDLTLTGGGFKTKSVSDADTLEPVYNVEVR